MIQTHNKSIIDNDVLMKGLIAQGKEAGYITWTQEGRTTDGTVA